MRVRHSVGAVPNQADDHTGNPVEYHTRILQDFPLIWRPLPVTQALVVLQKIDYTNTRYL